MKTVSELTGIPRNTLVAWERRHGVPRPERLANGYRLYSQADVALLLRLRDALAGGLAISEALEMVESGGEGTSAEAASPPGEGAFAAIVEQLMVALLEFDRPRADRVVERILSVPYLTSITEVYFPLLRAVGDGWAAGEVSIAQEHFASAFVRDQLVAMMLRVGAKESSGPRVACATFPGEKHELALLGLAIHLSLKGCRVTYLGADVPAAELGRFIRSSRQDCVCVSVIRSARPAEIEAFGREVTAGAPRGTRLVLGGAGLPELGGRPPRRVEIVRDWRDLSIA